MTELEKLKRAKMYLDKLANGIDPLTDTEVPEDNALNNVRLSRCFFYVSDVLRQVIDNGGCVKPVMPSAKADYELSPDCRSSLTFSDEPLQISRFVEQLNSCVDVGQMKKLTATVVTDWLLDKGFLEQVELEDGRKNRQPTPLGHKIGLSDEMRTGQRGTYKAVFYNEEAQRFVVNHLDEILQSYKNKSAKKDTYDLRYVPEASS